MAAIFEEFANGEAFNASDFNTLSMRQAIIACDNQTDRDSILTPQQGLTVYRKDLDCMQQYSGSTWRTYSPFPLGASRGHVATTESTTSTSYTKLTTTTDDATVEIGPSGMALVSAKASIAQSTTLQAQIAVAVTGATTISATTNASAGLFAWGIPGSASFAQTLSLVYLQTGLTAGTNTFEMMYATSTGTATFANRLISVIPL